MQGHFDSISRKAKDGEIFFTMHKFSIFAWYLFIMKKYFFVYIISNINRTTYYVGFTGNIKARLKQHTNKEKDGFAKKYNCVEMVYYEKFDNPLSGINREKQIKKYSRKKKLDLIIKINPENKSLNSRIQIIDDEYL
jgi:putative endonuclease